MRIADAENQIGSHRRELATGAFTDKLTQGGQVGGVFESGIFVTELGRRRSFRSVDGRGGE